MLLQENTMFANRYQLERLLGRGGFSEVWLAKDSYTKLDIAIKVYAPGQGMDSDGLADFSQELAGVFNLNHTNLLKPTHVDAWEGMPYLIMSFCSRGSLTKQIGKLSEQELWHVLHDVAAGLAYLHKNDIVHQDIKLDNILLDDSGNYVITDFGISTKARSTLRKSVIGGAVSGGTMAYMGPERFSKQPAPTKASDIWSLGAMMFELVTGNVPFGEMGGGMQKGGAEIPEIAEDISSELKTTIEQMLALETWDRPTADKLTEIASAHLSAMPTPAPQKEVRSTIPQQPKQEQPTSSRETQRFVSNDIAENPREEVPVEPITKTPVKKKRKWWIWVIIIILLVIAQRIWNWYVTRPATTEEVTPTSQVVDSETAATNSGIEPTPSLCQDKPLVVEVNKSISNSNNNQTFYNSTQKSSQTQNKDYDKISKANGYENGYEYVDLGLSVKWARCNIGAKIPDNNGKYFAWGETRSKSSYSSQTYKWQSKKDNSKFTKYCTDDYEDLADNKQCLDLVDDAAHAQMGGSWRLPTYEEAQELTSMCRYEWIKINNEYGCKIIGPNGNSIFLPTAGDMYGSLKEDQNTDGNYWTSTLYYCSSCANGYHDYNAYIFRVRDDGIWTINISRVTGCSIRAVCK